MKRVEYGYYYKKKKRNSKNTSAADNTQNTDTVLVPANSYTEADLGKILLSSSLEENKELVKQAVGMNADLVTRDITLGRSGTKSAVLYYIDSLIDSHHIDNNVVRPLISDVYADGLLTGDEIVAQILAGNVITRAQLKTGTSMKDLLEGLLAGELVFFVDGIKDVFIISVKGYDSRAISEPDVEPSVRGPRESFVEVLSINIGLIRRRIHSPNLVIESVTAGYITRTKVCIAYIRGICKTEMVDEARTRINRINVDGILESGQIEEFISDNPYSIFPLVRVTERPDSTVSSLLEGRIAVIVDGTPFALIVPVSLASLTQAAEDHYNSYIFSSLIRLVRYISIGIGTFLPALYIAVTNYHEDMLPENLIESIASSRAGVPFPAIVEAMLMELMFELLREAGVRLPRPVGPAVSIVGALVIGQSAVQASLVSPLMVIVVAATGIATFTMPQYNFSLPLRLIRFVMMILASVAGFYSMMIGALFILLHLCSLRSFGVPYLSPFSPFEASAIKDTVVRLPYWLHIKRPMQIPRNPWRMPSGQMPKPPANGGNHS